jgi:16S rRNA processing protein RimM
VGAGPAHLAVGLLKKPHGIKGDVLVFPVTDRPSEVFREGRRLTVLGRDGAVTGRHVVVTKARAYGRAWLVHFEGFDDRTALEALREVLLGIEIGEARPLAEGEFYLHELVGLGVQTADKTPVGTVAEVIEAPQGLLLAVRGGAKEHLIPFRADIIRRVDRTAGMVTVTPPEGLLEL